MVEKSLGVGSLRSYPGPRLTRGEKFIGECGTCEVDSMVNWQPVKRTEFNGNRPEETTRANVFWTR